MEVVQLGRMTIPLGSICQLTSSVAVPFYLGIVGVLESHADTIFDTASKLASY